MHRVQRRGGLPGLEADAGDRDAAGVGRLQRHAALVAGDDVAAGVGGGELDLQALDRAVGVADGAADGAGLAEDVPGLERLAELEVDAVGLDLAAEREAELGLRLEPVGAHVEAVRRGGRAARRGSPAQTKCGSMKRSCSTVPQRVRVPVTGRVPEPGDQRADQQLLGERHARVGGHLEAAELDEAEAAGGAVGGVELVDADLGAVGVAGDVGEEVAQQPVDEPGRRARRPGRAAASARARSRARRARRGGPRRCAAPGEVGPMKRPEKR